MQLRAVESCLAVVKQCTDTENLCQGTTAHLADVKFSETLRRSRFRGLRGVQKATHRAKPCVFGHLPGVSPKKRLYMACPVLRKRSAHEHPRKLAHAPYKLQIHKTLPQSINGASVCVLVWKDRALAAQLLVGVSLTSSDVDLNG